MRSSLSRSIRRARHCPMPRRCSARCCSARAGTTRRSVPGKRSRRHSGRGGHMTDSNDVISVAPVAEPDWPDAIRFFEQAVKAGNQDPHTLYLLAMAYKHQKRSGEARQTLAKIADPDANVLLQRGVLA